MTMTSIRSLLDTFGPPPQEIAIDWSAQIAEALMSPMAAGEDSAPGDSLLESDDWTTIVVQADGALQLDALRPAMGRRAVEELNRWSQPPRSAISAGLVAQHVPLRSRRQPRSSAFFHLRQTLRGKRLGLICASLVLCAAVLAASLRSLNRAESTSVSLAQSEMPSETPAPLKGLVSLAPASTNVNASTTPPSSIENSDKDLDLPLRNFAESIDPTQAVEGAKSSLTSPTSPLAGIEARTHLQPSLSRPRANEDNVVHSDTRLATVDPVVGATGDSMVGAKRDPEIQATVESMVEKMVDHEKETADLVPPTAAGTGTAIEFSRDDQLRYIELPKGVREKLSDPQWIVRLEVSEADQFNIEPAEPLVLGPRTGGQIRIFDSEAKSPRAYWIVEWLHRAGRDARLEMRVTGGAEDMPMMRLPLSRRWLDSLRTPLKSAQIQWQAWSEPVPAVIGGQERTWLQNRRRIAQQQTRVASRLLELTADLDRLATLLDKEVQCHAVLRAGDPPADIVRHGEP